MGVFKIQLWRQLMPNHFQAIHHVSMIISNIEQSIRFYCTVLELEIDPSRPKMSSEGLWLTINAQQQIHLLLTDDPYKSVKRPEHAGLDRHVALKVNDLKAIMMRLDKHGIAYKMSQSGRQALFCHDPDNNTLEIQE